MKTRLKIGTISSMHCLVSLFYYYLPLSLHVFWTFLKTLLRVVTKISSCRVNTTSRRGIKRLGISFGSIFLLFSDKSSQGPLSQQPGKIPGPWLLMTTLLLYLILIVSSVWFVTLMIVLLLQDTFNFFCPSLTTMVINQTTVLYKLYLNTSFDKNLSV